MKAKLFGVLDVELVRVLLKKKEATFKSMEAVACQFYDHLAQEVGSEGQLPPNTWASAREDW